jgi:hypothetical protein
MPVPADAAVQPVDIAIVAPSAAPKSLVDAMLETCRLAIGRSRCAQGDDGGPSRWTAIVRWDDLDPEDGASAASVEFQRGSAGGQPMETRHIAFDEGDSLRQRWITLGLVVASFVAARRADGAEPKATDTARQPAVKAAPPAWVPWSRWGLDVALGGGNAFASAPYRYCALVRGWLDGPVRGFSLATAFRYGDLPGTLSVQWAGTSLGIGYRIGDEGTLLSGELQGDAMVEHVALKAEDSTTGALDQDDRWRVGARFAAVGFLRLSSSTSLLLGAETVGMRPRLVVHVKDTEVASEPFATFAGFGGLRWVL